MSSNNRQLGLNMIASVLSSVVSFGISFFLTPYILKELGVAAYGFVGLATQIIGYSSIVTIALNSMAGRYVTIEYHKGDIEKANNYYSSVYYGNVILGILLFFISGLFVLFLEKIINIPEELILDVKTLFALLSINSILALLTNVYNISTFIKNKLDFSNIQGVIGNLLRALFLVVLFAVFIPQVWYFGLTALIATLYVSIRNLLFTKCYTPDLKHSKDNFDINSVKELISSGIWNLVTKLSNLLETGLNLLIANIFVGAKLAGSYSLAVTIPTMINSICSVMAGNFAPLLTKLYAEQNKEEMLRELFKSIRIMGFLSSIPISVFVVYGVELYRVLVPSEDATLLYWLSIASSLVMVVAMPLESLWNIFTITNQVKKSSINLLEWSIAIFVGIISGMLIVKDAVARLFIIALVKSVFASIRTLTFLPYYGAKCLGYDNFIFYPVIFRNLLCVFATIAIGLIIKLFLPTQSWIGLILGCLILCLVGVIMNWFLSLNESDRVFIKSKVNSAIRK